MVIIDVRSKHEYDSEHIDGALLFPVENIAAGQMPDVDKNEEIILYCRSGARSAMAANIMSAKGFTKVTSGGGLSHMAAAGHEIVR